jgi:hypothetical protein
VLRRERSLDIKKKEIRDKLTKASHLLVAYLNPNMSLCIALLLFLLLCIVFVYCYVPYIAIVGDLAPQVKLLSSLKMTPMTPTQYPEK